MIMYKKPSLEEIRASLRSTGTAIQTKWQAFQCQEHSRNEWLLIFALACIVGMAGKTIAIKTFTIGYEDYLISKTTVPSVALEKPVVTKGPICEE